MTHLRIELPTTGIELVSNSVIEKLYNLAISGDLDASSNLLGRLSVDGTYLEYIDELLDLFDELYISATNIYIKFYHLYVLDKIANHWRSNVPSYPYDAHGGKFTVLDAAISGMVPTFTNDTNLVKFNEFLYFTSVTTVANDMFQGCSNLEEITLPPALTKIGGWMFNGCSKLSSIILPSSVYEIGPLGFLGTKLSSIDLSNVTTIKSAAFKNCTSLTSVDLSSLTTVDGGANDGVFMNCTGLTTVTNLNKTGKYMFYGCTGLTTVGLTLNCTSIALNAFLGCNSLTSIDLSNVTSFGTSAFEGCTSLATVTWPSNDFSIGGKAFYNASISGNLAIDNITSLGNESFYGCNITSADFSNCSFTAARSAIFTSSSLISAIWPTTITSYGVSNNLGPTGNADLTELKGLDNVTIIESSSYGHINNAIYMGLLLSSPQFPIICSSNTSSASIKLLYLPKYQQHGSLAREVVSGVFNKSLCCTRCREDQKMLTIGLLYFKDLLSIGKFMFYCGRFHNLVINNTTPPALEQDDGFPKISNTLPNYTYWMNNIFGSNPTSGQDAMIIYVPDAAVATYQADSNYNSYTIRGINEVDPNTNQPYLIKYATNALWEAAGKPEAALIEEYM